MSKNLALTITEQLPSYCLSLPFMSVTTLISYLLHLRIYYRVPKIVIISLVANSLSFYCSFPLSLYWRDSLAVPMLGSRSKTIVWIWKKSLSSASSKCLPDQQLRDRWLSSWKRWKHQTSISHQLTLKSFCLHSRTWRTHEDLQPIQPRFLSNRNWSFIYIGSF